jgi:GT2 family glycosyltransferase
MPSAGLFCKLPGRERARRLALVVVTDIAPGAPAVVAVLLIADPGDRFDEVLLALAEQDYPNVRCLAMDCTQDPAVAARVLAVLPKAAVRQAADPKAGLGAAANEVRTLVAGSGFLWFLRDDVIPDLDAARLLLEEAYRSNVGIAGAKLVEAEEPRRLLSVGYGIDKFAERWQPIQPGELDQEQHDGVQDRFYLSSDCLLVRSDLFDTLGGFDETLGPETMDLDLCWRAHLSGARVLVAPAARARRLARPLSQTERDHAELRIANDRLRTILATYGIGHLIRILPQAMLVTFVMSFANLLVGHWRRSFALLAAWPASLAHFPAIFRKRRRIAALRRVSDTDLRRLQQRGSARLGALFKGSASGGEHRVTDALADSSRTVLAGMRSARSWAGFITATGLAALFLLASRTIVTSRLSIFGRFVRFSSSPRVYLRAYLSTWRPQGLGRVGSSPTGLGIIGGFGLASFGHMGLVRTLSVLVPLFLGPVGVWRLLRRATGVRGRAAGAAVYVLAPLATNAVSTGRWAGVLAYGAFPYVLQWILLASRAEPLAPADDSGVKLRTAAIRIALLVGIVAAFAPVIVVPVVATTLVLALTGLRRLSAAKNIAWVGLGGTLGALVLQLPWSASRSGMWESLASLREPGRIPLRVIDLLRFHTGPRGGGWTGWLVLGGLAVAVLVGQAWRFAWAARMAAVAISSFALAWLLGSRGRPFWTSDIEVLLVPALAATAVGVGLAVSAFEQDLHGHRLSWRQPAAFLGGCCVVIGLLPGLRLFSDGRWGAPAQDQAAPLRLAGSIEDQDNARVLWLGDPGSLPAAGWAIAPGFGYSVTAGIEPQFDDLWRSPVGRSERVVAEAIEAASTNSTHRLGQLLGPSAIRYIVVRQQRTDGTAAVTPIGLPEVLRRQLDLREVVLGDDRLQVFENQAWLPSRAQLSQGSETASRLEGTGSLIRADLSGASPILPAQSAIRASGPVEAGEVFVASTASSGWQLSVDGVAATRHPAFGWANSFTVRAPGDATLTYRSGARHPLLAIIQASLWGLAFLAGSGLRVRLPRRRGRRPGLTAGVLSGPAIHFDDVTMPTMTGAALADDPQVRMADTDTVIASDGLDADTLYGSEVPVESIGAGVGREVLAEASPPPEPLDVPALEPVSGPKPAPEPQPEPQPEPKPEPKPAAAPEPEFSDDIVVQWASDRTDENGDAS